MKGLHLAAALFLLLLASGARAATFDVTLLSFVVGPFNATLPGQVSFVLMGPGTNIAGIGNFVCESSWCSFPASPTPPGPLTLTVGQIGLDQAFQSTVGGTTLVADSWTVIDLSLNVLGSLNLPVNPNASLFTACVPASVPNLNFGEGQTLGGAFLQFNLNTPTQGTLCTMWNFIDNQYTFIEGTFSATVPEPGTTVLVGTGVLLLGMGFNRRRPEGKSARG